MGACLPKDITPIDPAHIVGSTVINGKSVMILGDSFLVPTVDMQSGETAVIELDINKRSVRIIRGYRARVNNSLIEDSKRKHPEAFASLDPSGVRAAKRSGREPALRLDEQTL